MWYNYNWIQRFGDVSGQSVITACFDALFLFSKVRRKRSVQDRLRTRLRKYLLPRKPTQRASCRYRNRSGFDSGDIRRDIFVIQYYRIQCAKKILKDTNYSISKIAEAVGISGGDYFCRVFRKYNGGISSPTEYRKA